MSSKLSLSDRMKMYEEVTRGKLPQELIHLFVVMVVHLVISQRSSKDHSMMISST